MLAGGWLLVTKVSILDENFPPGRMHVKMALIGGVVEY